MVITISREYGAGGSEVARRVAAALGWSVVDNELVEQVAARAGLALAEVAERDERVPSFVERLARTLAASLPELVPAAEAVDSEEDEPRLVRITEKVVADLTARGRVVLVGRAAPVVLGRRDHAMHIRLVAPRSTRIREAVERLGIDPAEAARIVDETDAMRARYHLAYYERDWTDPLHYDMTLNTELLGLQGATDVIVGRARAMGWGERL